jgi:outer membrane protein OmpA-like peptidoglycan-associated protein
VRIYLRAHGVAVHRVAVDGRGSSEPIAAHTTDTGRARKRRVDIFVGEAPVG